MSIENTLPHNQEAERAILAAGLLDNAALPTISECVKAEDFFIPQNRVIYLAQMALAAAGKPVDLVTLIETLQRSDELEKAGGGAYVSSIADGFPKIQNVKHHAAIVRENAISRRVVHTCNALGQAAMEGEESKSVLERGAQEFLAMMSADGAASLPHKWSEAVAGAMDQVISGIRDPGKMMRIFCGIPKLDEAFGGFRRQEVILCVGMTSHGKSLISMQFGTHADVHGYKGLVISAEMSKEALASRELAYTAKVPLYYLRRPEKLHHPDAIIAKLMEAAGEESKRSLLVVDRDITPSRIWSLCELVHRSQGLDFVIVDYDQLVVRAGLKGGEDEFSAQAKFMANALELAKRLNLCFILLCQPRKVDEDVARGKRPPRVEQIFGSSAVANTAHVIFWIMRKFFQKGMDPVYEKVAQTFILKARNDKTGTIDHGFDPDLVRFVNEQEVIIDAPEEESRAAKRKKAKKGDEDAA